MNPIILTIILVPVIEIYLLIKIGGQIGALTTIMLIFTTAVIGVYYAKYEGLNTLKAGFEQLRRNVSPTYEMMSGAAIEFGALFLIIPGFATDIIGFLAIFPISRKIILNIFFNKPTGHENKKNNFIDGEYEDIEEDDDKKI